MKKSILLGVAISLIAIADALAAAPAMPPAGLESARKSLAAAVAAHDLKAIVGLSSFPLPIEAYQTAPKLTAQKFLSDKNQFTNIFGDGDASIVDCIRSTALQLQSDPKQFGTGEWYADCNGNEYYFALQGHRWLFAGYQNINE